MDWYEFLGDYWSGCRVVSDLVSFFNWRFLLVAICDCYQHLVCGVDSNPLSFKLQLQFGYRLDRFTVGFDCQGINMSGLPCSSMPQQLVLYWWCLLMSMAVMAVTRTSIICNIYSETCKECRIRDLIINAGAWFTITIVHMHHQPPVAAWPTKWICLGTITNVMIWCLQWRSRVYGIL